MLDKVKNAGGDFIPERPYYKNSIECKSCSVFDKCWGVSDDILDLTSLSGEELEELSNIALDYITQRDIGKEADDKKEDLRIWLDKFLIRHDVNELQINAGLEILTAKISESFKTQSDLVKLQENYPEVHEDITSYEYGGSLRISTKINPDIKLKM